MFATHVLALTLTFAAPDKKAEPVAMVLARQGSAIAGERSVGLSDFLRDGETLRVSGSLMLVTLKDGVKQRVTGEVKLTAKGAEAADDNAKVSVLPGRFSGAQLSGLNRLARSGRGGVVVPRGEPESLPKFRPWNGESVLETTPMFAWGLVDTDPPLTGYTLTVSSDEGSKKEVFSLSGILEAESEYPEGVGELERGHKYAAVVKKKGVVLQTLRFRVATEEELAEFKKLAPLAKSDEPGDWFMAACGYTTLGRHPEAMALFGKLAAEFPKEPAYQWALVNCYERAGEVEKAKQAFLAAKKLDEPSE